MEHPDHSNIDLEAVLQPQRRTLNVQSGGKQVTVAWFMPGTSSADLHRAIAARLGLPADRTLVLEDDSGAALAISPALPSGLTVRLAASMAPSGPAAAAAAAAAAAPADGSMRTPLLSSPPSTNGCCSSGWAPLGSTVLQPLELETDPRSPQESMVMMNRDTDNMLKLSRVGSALANERTLLAWLRTACSMFALSCGIYNLDKGESENLRWLAFITGLVVALLAAGAFAHGVERYFRMKRVLLMRGRRVAKVRGRPLLLAEAPHGRTRPRRRTRVRASRASQPPLVGSPHSGPTRPAFTSGTRSNRSRAW